MNCTAEGCERQAKCRGLCAMHYKRKPNAIRRRDWSDVEKATIVAQYATMGPIALSAIMHGRSAKAIKVKAFSMWLAKRRTEREVDPQVETMVGAALCMWKGPVNREQPMRWSVAA